MDLSIIIINYQTKKFLKTCLESVFTQKTEYDFEVMLIDNASEDLRDIKIAFPEVILLNNTVNIGFANAANQGITMSEADYIMTLNPDVILEPDYIEKCMNVLEGDKKLASVTGKLLYYDFKKNRKTNILDSTGLVQKRTKHAYDRGQGEKDKGQYDNKQDIWGVSAAAGLYRRSALEQCKDAYGYFDYRFFMYKEDVDLAWRLARKKYKSAFIPEAIAYHRRGTGIATTSLISRIRNRKKTKSEEVRMLSLRNQLLAQKKNKGFTFIAIVYLLLILAYVLVFEQKLLKNLIKQKTS